MKEYMLENEPTELDPELKAEFANLNRVLADQAVVFSQTVAPYMMAEQNISEYINNRSTDLLEGMSFFRLQSCTTESVEDISIYLNSKMEKLFTAIHPLGSPVLYGVISRGRQANIVLGVEYSQKETVKSIINGLLTGIELEENKQFQFRNTGQKNSKGGFITSVPITKVGEDRQQFDISALMKSLNGRDYTALVYASPLNDAQDRYSGVLAVKDKCFAVSKRSVQISENTNKAKTETITTNRRGVFQEVAFQALKARKFNAQSLLDSITDAGTKSLSIAESETSVGKTTGISFEIQNSMAIEMIGYCDKAIERMKLGQASGLWDATITYAAEDSVSLGILKACLLGELSKPSTDILPLGQFDYPADNKHMVLLPSNVYPNNPLFAPIISAELGMVCTPPSTPVPDFELRIGKLYPMIPSTEGGVVVGKVADGHRPLDNMPFSLTDDELNKHTFVCGITGSGKTTTVKGILRGSGKPYLVIESAKKEYRSIPDIDDVFTLGKPEINCIQMNPFYVQCGINLQTHIDFLKDLFNASFSFYGPMPYILEKCLGNIYRKRGWNLTLGYHPLVINIDNPTNVFDANYMQRQYALKSCEFIFPTMQDLKDEVKRYIETEMQYEGEVAGNIKSAILARLESLCVGSKGYMFNSHSHLDMAGLMTRKVVFELEGLADDSDKAFCVGLLVIFINEYQQVVKELDKSKGLKHLLVIEEAHRLLKNVDTEKSSESMGNPKGKAVEHFTNMIAEMRSYGQGVIIAEQIPSKLAPDVIKNSSNKIVQRIVSADDQALVANTIGIKAEDAVFLGTLRTGFGLCHKEGMQLPVFVEINDAKDTPISDGDIVASAHRDVTETFDAINRQLITESISDVLDVLAFQVLNTLLVMDMKPVASDIRNCRERITTELRRKEVSLLPMTNARRESLYGKILSERILMLFNFGVYSFGQLVPEDLREALEELCVRAIDGRVAPVKELLKSLYKRECRAQGIEIVYHVAAHNIAASDDLEKKIRAYFLSVDDEVIDTLIKKIKAVKT